jgi:hypothetical protein
MYLQLTKLYAITYVFSYRWHEKCSFVRRRVKITYVRLE